MHEESPFHGIDVGSLSSPEVVDWDKDGLGDLIVGSDDGTLHFFRGSRYGTLVRAVSEQNPLHGIDIGAFISPEATAAAASAERGAAPSVEASAPGCRCTNFGGACALPRSFLMMLPRGTC